MLLSIPGKKGDGGVLNNETAYNKNTFNASFSIITIYSRFNPSIPPLVREYSDIVNTATHEDTSRRIPSLFLEICVNLPRMHSDL